MKMTYGIDFYFTIPVDHDESVLDMPESGPIAFIQIDRFNPAEGFAKLSVDVDTLEHGMEFWGTDLEGSAHLTAQDVIRDYIEEHYGLET